MEAFISPIVETIVSGLNSILKDEVLSIFNVKKELEKTERKMQEIMSIIKIAEKQSLDDEGVRSQLTTLKDIAYDIDDIIDDCKVKAHVLASSSSRSTTGGTHLQSFSRLRNFIFSYKIGKRIKEINVKLQDIVPSCENQQQSDNAQTHKTTHFVIDDMMGCVEEEANKLMKLMLHENESGGSCVNLAILGMGGIGKTTLARMIFDEVTKRGTFQHKVWICVSKDFKREDLVKEIVRQARGNYGKGESLNELQDALERVVRDKKLFLVLDDVWNANIWDSVLKGPLKSCANGSKIIITTRGVNIAKMISASYLHEVKLLSIEEGWSLLCNNVFKTKSERDTSGYFKDIGVKIVEKCGRLPLAIKTIAGILETKEKRISEWEKIISNEVWSQNIYTDNDVIKSLYLSYKDLSYQLKQCFVYCSLFPEDYSFNKVNLVGMWIAEGFLENSTSLVSGEVLVEELVNMNLLQQHGSTHYYKLHGLLRSLGQILGNGEYFYENLKNLDDSARRLSFQDENPLAHDHPQRFHKRLRTLMLFKSSKINEIPKSVFQRLQYLRVLSLSGTGIHVIPDSIKNLSHLRYLDLSSSKIRIISKSVGYLKNLQFLHLQECEFLEKLPNSITSLQNLISLISEVQMPKGIGTLKQLQCLKFRVAENENEAKFGCTMQELQSFNLLNMLCIFNLQKYLSLKEAKSMELLKKDHLQELTLNWKPIKDVSDEDMNRATEVFEEFCPPSSLLRLFILNFCGNNLPNWMSYSNGISLSNLLHLEINGCEYCQQLPGFGKLPQLKVLQIYDASSIQKIGPKFLGRGDISIGTNFCPFAKLKSMRLENFSKLEQWYWDEAEDNKDGGATPFPCLQYLFIVKCPKLKSLPGGLQHATSLVEVVLDGNKDLERIPRFPTVKDLLIKNC